MKTFCRKFYRTSFVHCNFITKFKTSRNKKNIQHTTYANERTDIQFPAKSWTCSEWGIKKLQTWRKKKCLPYLPLNSGNLPFISEAFRGESGLSLLVTFKKQSTEAALILWLSCSYYCCVGALPNQPWLPLNLICNEILNPEGFKGLPKKMNS